MIHFNKKFQSLVIIKTGQTETFEDDTGLSISLGDVLRTTVLLREAACFSKILWLTSREAEPLIPRLENLDVQILEKDQMLDFSDLQNALVLNLEKINNLTDRILISGTSKLIGAIKNPTSTWRFYDIHDVELNLTTPERTWGQKLLKLIGSDLTHSTGICSSLYTQKKYDVGLNWKVGSKWPSKQMSEQNWKKIEKTLASQRKVSWQQGHNNLFEYIQWVASCRLMISTDSLGLHLAVCMGIPTIGLFGSTDFKQIDRASNTKLIEYASKCIRCLNPVCDQEKHCSEFLNIEHLVSVAEILAP